jgi:hypothetical protein
LGRLHPRAALFSFAVHWPKWMLAESELEPPISCGKSRKTGLFWRYIFYKVQAIQALKSIQFAEIRLVIVSSIIST